jgi:hypothetical protein
MATRMRLRAVFDGEVLRPEQPVDLQPNTTYVVTIEEASDVGAGTEPTYPLTEIRRLATDMGVTDLSTGHDRYAHDRIVDGDHAS